jgi:hypothetical protein
MFQRSQTCTKLAKPKLDLSLLDTNRSVKQDDSILFPKLKTPKSAHLPEKRSRANAATAPQKSKFLESSSARVTINPNASSTERSAELASPSAKKSTFKSKSAFLSNIKQRKNLKSRLIKEWAFKNIKNSDLGVEMLKSATKKPTELETPLSRLRNQTIYVDKDLLKEENEAAMKLISHHVNLATLDDDVNILEGFRPENRNPALNVNKEMTKRSQEARVLDNELIELSKARFKMLGLMENQKKGFVERQLVKSKALPGLK